MCQDFYGSITGKKRIFVFGQERNCYLAGLIYSCQGTILFRLLHRHTTCLPEIRFMSGRYPALTWFHLSQNNSAKLDLFEAEVHGFTGPRLLEANIALEVGQYFVKKKRSRNNWAHMPWIRVEAALWQYFAFFHSFLELDEKKTDQLLGHVYKKPRVLWLGSFGGSLIRC